MNIRHSLLLAFALGAFVNVTCAQEKVVVEKFASFAGGAEKFYEYIAKKIKYPEDAKRDSITGDVHVQFVVSSTGNILPESIKVLKGLSVSCDAEAMRIIKEAPKWIAGSTKTASIEQTITFPVSFIFK